MACPIQRNGVQPKPSQRIWLRPNFTRNPELRRHPAWADARRRSGDVFLPECLSAGLRHWASSDRLTLRNLGFPLTPNTLADTSLGTFTAR